MVNKMKWYRINIDYLSKYYDNLALSTSSPGGDNLKKAKQLYYDEISKNYKCCDNKEIPARINLTEYSYNKKK